MKLICKYSGVTLTAKQFSGWEMKTGVHPLMQQDAKALLSYVPRYYEKKLSLQEEYIYFIALLRSTEHVEFLIPAAPMFKTVLKNMERLIKAVGWMHAIQHNSPVYYSLPKFVVNHSTFTLDNIHTWLGAWEEIKSDWSRQVDTQSFKRRHELRERALEKLALSPYRKLSSYIDVVLTWAFAASNTPPAYKEQWTKIASAKLDDLQYIPVEDIIYMVDYMNEHLAEAAGSISHTVTMKLLRSQLRRKKLGVLAGLEDLGETEEDIDNLFNSLTPRTPLTYSFVTDNKVMPSGEVDAETHNKILMINKAPTEEPKEKNYSNKFQYLLAVARYNLAVKYRADLGITSDEDI